MHVSVATMRLLKTDMWDSESHYIPTFQEFEGQNIPKYAILSHTWGSDEMTYANVIEKAATTKRGYHKVENAVRQAWADGHFYIWVDTCCIDKSSSAELSEAINSMFAWYRDSQTCYAHLADVSEDKGIVDPDDFKRSRWFTRGWTLQELLAPNNLEFLAANWIHIGTRARWQSEIAEVTKINLTFLHGSPRLDSVNVATRMSWAARRQTTRVEDVAYSLMGIFSVSMPLLYGEGPKAFFRLQEEIIKSSDDHSLFAWADPTIDPNTVHGLLADSPMSFANVPIFSYGRWSARGTYGPFRNGGLQIELPLSKNLKKRGYFYATLNCPGPSGCSDFTGIHLMNYDGGQEYGRVSCHKLSIAPYFGRPQTIFVKQQADLTDNERAMYPWHFIKLDLHGKGLSLSGCKLVRWRSTIMTQSELAFLDRDYPNRQSSQFVTMPKEAVRASTALLFESVTDETLILVLLGSLTNMDIGFCATMYHRRFLKHGNELAERYQDPVSAGSSVFVNGFCVSVASRLSIKREAKIFELNISISGQAERKQVTPKVPSTLVSRLFRHSNGSKR